MRRVALLEKLFHNKLLPDFTANVHFTFDYWDYLWLIQKHLHTFYVQRIEWSLCVDACFTVQYMEIYAITLIAIKTYQLAQRNISIHRF